MDKQMNILRSEFTGWQGRLHLVQAFSLALPSNVGSRVRVALLRMIGFSIGQRTVMWGMPTILGSGNIYQHLTIGQACWFNIGCIFELGAAVHIADRAVFGPQVMLLTTTHHLGDGDRRAGLPYAEPVQIGEGAWLCARSTILPGITIGAGAVVAAGAVVTKDVPPNTIVGGVPARTLRQLTASDERGSFLPAFNGTLVYTGSYAA